MSDARLAHLETLALTLLTLVCFASNSLLTRFALGAHEIDAATFVFARLAAGAIVLAILMRMQAGTFAPLRLRGVVGPLALLAYAAPFSFAYLRIGAAVGALVLFGVVQLTMIGFAIACGERASGVTWLGLVVATGGLAALTLPSAHRPDPLGVTLMVIAGIAWGVYSFVGRGRSDALASNARSFLWGSVPAALLLVAERSSLHARAHGIALALISGGVTSGLGYALRFRTLPRISFMQAAAAQLSVPALAAIGAALILGERLTTPFVLSAAAVLGGVAIVLLPKTTTTT